MKAIGYIRISSKQKQTSGLSLEEQEASIREFSQREGFEVEQVYVEKASGAIDDRPILNKAMRHAKKIEGHIIVSKLDRLSRRVSFISQLMERNVPMLTVEFGTQASPFMLHIWAAVAEQQRMYISQRTKEALRRKKLRDKSWKAGNPNWKKTIHHAWKANVSKADERALELEPIIDELKSVGILTLAATARALNARGIKTATNKQWHPTTVSNLLRRISKIRGEENG
jgi:DNA invertase Pin-like site-specific DNA recombinase